MCQCLNPGGVDWVASHPFLEQSTKKYNTWGNKWKYVGGKNLVKPTIVLPKSACFGTKVQQLKINNV